MGLEDGAAEEVAAEGADQVERHTEGASALACYGNSGRVPSPQGDVVPHPGQAQHLEVQPILHNKNWTFGELLDLLYAEKAARKKCLPTWSRSPALPGTS